MITLAIMTVFTTGVVMMFAIPRLTNTSALGNSQYRNTRLHGSSHE